MFTFCSDVHILFTTKFPRTSWCLCILFKKIHFVVMLKIGNFLFSGLNNLSYFNKTIRLVSLSESCNSVLSLSALDGWTELLESCHCPRNISVILPWGLNRLLLNEIPYVLNKSKMVIVMTENDLLTVNYLKDFMRKLFCPNILKLS